MDLEIFPHSFDTNGENTLFKGNCNSILYNELDDTKEI